jgi:glyoxylase-like metal-dependent hydrolase (beta-lactamase superfamily II)
MKQLRQDLWQTTPQTDGAINCAYLLKRPAGNVLVYNAFAAHDIERMAALGGVAHHVLCHRHEADQGNWKSVRDTFGAKLCSGRVEADALSGTPAFDIVFDGPHDSLGDIEVLDTPGHTQGGISCVYRSPFGGTYLFCADNLVPVKDYWLATIVAEHGGDVRVLADSLAKYRALAPDLVLASTAVGELIVELPSWSDVIETNIANLSAG